MPAMSMSPATPQWNSASAASEAATAIAATLLRIAPRG